MENTTSAGREDHPPAIVPNLASQTTHQEKEAFIPADAGEKSLVNTGSVKQVTILDPMEARKQLGDCREEDPAMARVVLK